MKLLKNTSAFFFLAVFSLLSCTKNVDLKPIDLVPIQDVFKTVADLDAAANGAYGTWLARRASWLSTTFSDEARQGIGAEYRNIGAFLFRWEHTSDAQDFRDDEQAGAWTNLYTVIDRANRALFYFDNVTPANTSEAATKDRIKGELLALRAFAHFELMRWYAPRYNPDALGVPYMEVYAKDPGNFKPTRMKSSDVYTIINADLAQAKSLIPASFIDNSRITKNAVSAMQARVALYTNNWDVAIANATEAINIQPLTASGSYAALWKTRNLPNNQSNEVIWKLNVTASNIGSAIGSLYQDANTAIQFSPSSKLMNSYSVEDIRPAIFFAKRTADNRDIIAKYGAIVATPTTENFVYDIKMLRTSEMYLIRAEAYAEKNDLINAAADINVLRTQRITGYIPIVFASKDEAITEILLERYRELAYEGHRYFDLKRRDLAINRLPEDVQGNPAFQTLNPTNFKYLLPIPQQEIFANGNIQQNPGY